MLKKNFPSNATHRDSKGHIHIC